LQLRVDKITVYSLFVLIFKVSRNYRKNRKSEK